MIERKEIEHLAKLSRLSFSEDEMKGFEGDINAILSYVDQLQEVAVEEKDPTLGAVYNVIREDENAFEGGEHRNEIVDGFPQKENGFVKVKKIL